MVYSDYFSMIIIIVIIIITLTAAVFVTLPLVLIPEPAVTPSTGAVQLPIYITERMLWKEAGRL